MKNSILGLGSDLRFFICQNPIKMNKGIEGLRGIIINELGKDPDDGSVYIFVSRDRRQIKILHYDNGIYTLYIRRLFHGRFVYPELNTKSDTYQLDWIRLRRMLTRITPGRSLQI